MWFSINGCVICWGSCCCCNCCCCPPPPDIDVFSLKESRLELFAVEVLGLSLPADWSFIWVFDLFKFTRGSGDFDWTVSCIEESPC